MDELAAVVGRFSGLKIVVLGDLVLDYYLYGSTDRVSREAPVLVVKEERCEARLGGAANVAANVKSLGGIPVLVGLCGRDQAGEQMLRLCEETGLNRDGVVAEKGRSTVTKTRVLAGGLNTVRQQMLRVDRLAAQNIGTKIEERLLARLSGALKRSDALLVSDYREGVLSDRLLRRVLAVCRRGRPPVFVDARRGIERFRGARALTPNEPELAAAAGIDLGEAGRLEAAGRWLLGATRAGCVLVKRGRNGMALFERRRRARYLPAFGPLEVADVTGAGDTVLATFGLACAAGAGVARAMILANMAGGIKVTKSGTAVVKAAELLAAAQSGA